jgi:hypothetical protein
VSTFASGRDRQAPDQVIPPASRMVMYFNPLRVLMPSALFLLGLGAGKGIYDLVVHRLHVANDTLLIFVTGMILASLALLADLIVRSRGNT